MLPGDLRNGIHTAKFGDNGTGWFKVIFTHGDNVCDYREFLSSDFCELRDRKFCESRDHAAMSDPQHEIRLWMQEQLNQSPHGTKGRLAKHLGVRPDAITRMANTDPKKETREIRAHELDLMRAFFSQAEGAPQDDDGMEVPVMGHVGAGSEVMPDFEQVPPEGIDQVHVPFHVPDDLIAFTVRGTSMLPYMREGTIIIVYREQQKPIEAFYGLQAAVRTADGKRFIKTITRGSNGGVNLISWNAEEMYDVHLEWIGEIFAILPPSATRKVERQGGIQGQLKLRA
ncbi:S24 family peptidase [Nitratireductor sp. L1-7-SE]|uniref:S24 family peptidase n=1 Tax=Nitratireductor rhodophyticola TaxID=2854036 RepID=A0ABS7RCZ6_9HYPH|nr:S24 family peptidase [Nitratireductor rhodophyticola]MBY8918794.1 S24 family peptidase [Nitratireductor rhodophyticola]MBY8920022.1 S24 family peptidase [Nitratireductor rhodophyticola]